MRAFLILSLLVLSVPAFATEITRESANAYYESCKAGQAQGMSPQTQDLMCACTAAKMMETMTVEEVQVMGDSTNPGQRSAFNKMMTQVYAPCIEYPARDHYYNTCISNPQTAQLGAPGALCDCLANEVAGYLKANAQSVFEDLLARNPGAFDPMSALTGDPQFQQFAQTKLTGCVR